MPPWIVWHKPLSWLTNLTQDYTENINLHLFYKANLGATATQTSQLSQRILQTFLLLFLLIKLLANFLLGHSFFVMCSWEYAKVTRYHKTKLFQIKNIQFFKWKKYLDHEDPRLHLADCMPITFWAPEEKFKKWYYNSASFRRLHSLSSKCSVLKLVAIYYPILLPWRTLQSTLFFIRK